MKSPFVVAGKYQQEMSMTSTQLTKPNAYRTMLTLVDNIALLPVIMM